MEIRLNIQYAPYKGIGHAYELDITTNGSSKDTYYLKITEGKTSNETTLVKTVYSEEEEESYMVFKEPISDNQPEYVTSGVGGFTDAEKVKDSDGIRTDFPLAVALLIKESVDIYAKLADKANTVIDEYIEAFKDAGLDKTKIDYNAIEDNEKGTKRAQRKLDSLRQNDDYTAEEANKFANFMSGYLSEQEALLNEPEREFVNWIKSEKITDPFSNLLPERRSEKKLKIYFQNLRMSTNN